ncbi:tyrosine-type recombinase/integrase [Frankia sp. QA3]|uniref:tyrosine-type recombinase/integrase n=1 Tax=Frankia sp. QA3 TaxID=710111 RepID=UPI001E451F56|nr:tyrosine-type recombinase/integrase [Frankia sp. QA3]
MWAVREVKGKKRSAWQARWSVAGRPTANARSFATKGAAEARRAEIFTAVKKGEAFDVVTGLPVREVLAQRAAKPPPAPRSWLEVARGFTDAKWEERQAPGSRRSIAQGLSSITVALFDAPVPAEFEELVREALAGWSFNTGVRTTPGRDGRSREVPPPDDWAGVLEWMERHSRPVTDLADPEVARAALGALSRRMDSRPAAGNTIVRRRQVFEMAIKYAMARGDLDANPLTGLDWRPPRKLVAVDRRVVVNADQARRLFAAVAEHAPDLEAFYARIYHAALRPGELQELRLDQLTLPESGWGEALLDGNNPEISPRWSDAPDGPRQPRELKHRAKGETRPVPLNPRLVAILRRHVDTFGITADGRLFRSGKDGPVKAIRYLARWRQAREIALTPAEQASPLARRPYDLRHAAISGWLNAGVPVTQAAEWAGHSVRVCMLVYAKCIAGQDEAARRRIDAALAAESDTPVVPAAPEAADSHPRLIHSQPETTGLDRTPPGITPAVPEPPTGPDLEF